MSRVVVAQLLNLEAADPQKPIAMYIQSPGGRVDMGLAIYDTMQYIENPITTVCMGDACSMGSLLLAAGDPGMRYSLPNSRIMVHQPSGGVGVGHPLLPFVPVPLHMATEDTCRKATLRSYSTGALSLVVAGRCNRCRDPGKTHARPQKDLE